MFLDSVGIILKKKSSSSYNMTILDKVQGKIECVTTTPSLSAGSLITYNINKQQSTHFISNNRLIYSPLSLAQHDILFFHHVLELIYFFTTIGNHSDETFNLLAFLYSTTASTITTQFKKIFLLKLLFSMDSIPDHHEMWTQNITHLATIDIMHLNKLIIDTITEKELDRWLWCCISQHPYVNEFKTVHFLAENGTL